MDMNEDANFRARERGGPVLTAAVIAVLPMVIAGCSAGGGAGAAHKIYLDPDGQVQMIAFEIDALPGEMFKIVIPEKISAKHGNILEWNHPVPAWDIGPDHASWSCEVPGVIRQRSCVLFGPKVIEARVEITNLSDQTWELAQAFTCFAFYAAPRFDNPELDRIRLPIGDEWRSVAEIFAERDPGPKPYTFFPVRDGPPPRDMEIVRRVGQVHPQVVAYGAGCVMSRDHEWIAGMYCPDPAYVFCNRRERCIHANPLFPTLAPGETASASSYILITKGGVADFERSVREALD